MKIDIENPEAILYEYRVRLLYMNSLTGATCEPTPVNPMTPAPDSKPDWKPQATWISKRRFVRDVLPDAVVETRILGKSAIVSAIFSGYTSGGSLTGWNHDKLSQLWTRAYDALTQQTFAIKELNHRVSLARYDMAEREKGRGRTQPDPKGVLGSPVSGYERRFHKDLRAIQALGRGARTPADYPDFPRGVIQPARFYRPDDDPKEVIGHMLKWDDPELIPKLRGLNVPEQTIDSVLKDRYGRPFQFFTKTNVFGTAHHFMLR